MKLHSQRELAMMLTDALRHISISDPMFPPAVRTLQRVVDIAQKRPDGSIDGTTWNELTEILKTARETNEKSAL